MFWSSWPKMEGRRSRCGLSGKDGPVVAHAKAAALHLRAMSHVRRVGVGGSFPTTKDKGGKRGGGRGDSCPAMRELSINLVERRYIKIATTKLTTP